MSHLDQMTQKFKGQYVRIYKTKLEFTDGILLGNWNNRYVTLSFQKEKATLVYIPDLEAKLILPIKTYSLAPQESICKNLYSSLN